MALTEKLQNMPERTGPISWRVRVALLVLTVLAVVTVVVTNNLLTDRFTQNTRNRGSLSIAVAI